MPWTKKIKSTSLINKNIQYILLMEAFKCYNKFMIRSQIAYNFFYLYKSQNILVWAV